MRKNQDGSVNGRVIHYNCGSGLIEVENGDQYEFDDSSIANQEASHWKILSIPHGTKVAFKPKLRYGLMFADDVDFFSTEGIRLEERRGPGVRTAK